MVKVIQELTNWKNVDFDPDNFADGAENLIAIEELTDYKLENERGISEVSRKKKKSKKRKNDKSGVTKKAVKKNVFQVTEVEEAYSTDSLAPWSDIFVPEFISKSLLDQGFSTPTEIQKLSIPAALKGRRDILGAAETGSGKTLAFGIPIIYGIMKNLDKLNSDDDAEGKLWALVLTPTRELAVQIKDHLEVAAKYTPVKIAVVVGGLSSEKQSRILGQTPHIVVATPGRLWDLVKLGEPHFKDIKKVKFLAIDETDKMLENNHFPELRSLLEKINSDPESAKTRQNFVFSATLTLVHDPPQYIKKKRWRKSISKLMLSPSQKLDSIIKLLGITEPKVVDITNKSGTAKTLTETRILCNHDEKDFYLYYFLIAHPGRTLVFCNSIDCVKRLSSLLNLLNVKALPLHSSMIQKQRLKNLERFSEGNGVLLATDVAARGLDIPKTEHVVHYQVPRTSEGYVHRSGRTARADRPGLTLVLVSPEEASVYGRTLSNLNRELELDEFPVDENVLRVAKDRVIAARKVDIMVLHKKRESNKRSWLEKAAEEADIILDDSLKIQKADLKEEADNKRAFKVAKKVLDSLLAQRITIASESAVEKVQKNKIKTKIKIYKKKKKINTDF